MRIITGTARGKRLQTPDGLHTRPTADRVKQSVFNIIQFDIEGRKVLDLFGGSGQLGLEAMSRGAASCVIVDGDRAAQKAIEANKEGRPFLVEAPMENIVVPTPGCWNINDIYTPNELVKEGKLVRKENGRYVTPNHAKSHNAKSGSCK